MSSPSSSPEQSPHEAGDPVEASATTPDENEQNSDSNLNNKDDKMPRDDPDALEGMGYDFEVKEQDRWLPIANVARIMKTALPDNAKIAKEAKECMQECVSEFISFITSEASEKCQQEKRKTVNGEDILFAMTSLGFENYGEALKIYLARYRENLTARGGDQKPVGTGATTTTTSTSNQDYDNNQSALANPLETGADSATDYAYASNGADY